MSGITTSRWTVRRPETSFAMYLDIFPPKNLSALYLQALELEPCRYWHHQETEACIFWKKLFVYLARDLWNSFAVLCRNLVVNFQITPEATRFNPQALKTIGNVDNYLSLGSLKSLSFLASTNPDLVLTFRSYKLQQYVLISHCVLLYNDTNLLNGDY